MKASSPTSQGKSWSTSSCESGPSKGTTPLRTSGIAKWAHRDEGLEDRYTEAVESSYQDVCRALRGSNAYVTYGNVDRPKMLAEHLPDGARFVDAEVVEIDGLRVGFAGGGLTSIGTPGEVTEQEMRAKLDQLGPVDILATHVPPAVPALACDVIGGRQKGSVAVLEYVERQMPSFHYFGDIHQPRDDLEDRADNLHQRWVLQGYRARDSAWLRSTSTVLLAPTNTGPPP